MGGSRPYVASATLMLVLAGCVGGPPATSPSPPAERTRSVAAKAIPTTTLTGVVVAPPGILSNNGSSIISDNGGSYRLLAAEAWKPVVDGAVLLVDAFDRPVRGVPEARTDAEGRFSLKGVPIGAGYVVKVKAGPVQLTGLVRADATPAPIAVDPATTVVTAHLAATFAAARGNLALVPADKFAALAGEVRAALQAGEVPIDVSTDAAAKGTYDAIAAKDAEAASGGAAIVEGTKLAAEEAVAKGTIAPIDLVSPPPTPAPTEAPPGPAGATPTPAPVAATPTPVGATPTPAGATSAPTATPTPGGTPAPTTAPTSAPSTSPSPGQSASPTPGPTPAPSPSPSSSASPTASPSASPTASPTPAPAIIVPAFSPCEGSPSMRVTLTGSNFVSPATANTVKFGGATATVLSGTTTSLVVAIPAGAADGPITVAAAGRTTGASTAFAVEPSGHAIMSNSVTAPARCLALTPAGRTWYTFDVNKKGYRDHGDCASGGGASGSSGTGSATGIAVDAGGLVWVGYAGTDEIRRFGTTGNLDFAKSTGAASASWVATAGTDVWVADGAGGFVGRYNSAGTLQASVTPGPEPHGAIATDAGGNAWVTTLGGTKLYKISPAGTVLTSKTVASSKGVAVGPDGQVWATGLSTGKLYKIAADGSVADTFDAGMTAPERLAVDLDGDLWVCQPNAGKLTQISSTGTKLGEIDLPGVADVAVDAMNRLRVTQADGTLAVIAP